MTPVDRQLLKRLLQPRLGDSQRPVRLIALTTSYRRPEGNIPSAIAVYQQRAVDFAAAHYRLMQEAPEYQAGIAELEAYVILELLPANPTQAEAWEPLLCRMMELGIADSLIRETGGPLRAPLPPKHLWWNPGTTGFLGSGRGLMTEGVEDALHPFHCCGGRLTITDLGRHYSRFVEAHATLVNTDREYRREFQRIAEPLERRLRRLPRPLGPAELQVCDQVTATLRKEMRAEGLVQKLTSVATATIDSERTEP